MKLIPQYSLVIFPPPEPSRLVISYKQSLKSKISFGSSNSAPHITIIQFANDLEYEQYINQVREFCKIIVPQNVTFNSWGKFERAAAFFIAPDNLSKIYLNSLIIGIHDYLDFKVERENVNAHITIGRKLFGEKMQIAEELFKNTEVNLEFTCDTLHVRKFNTVKRQYSDSIEKISFGK